MRDLQVIKSDIASLTCGVLKASSVFVKLPSSIFWIPIRTAELTPEKQKKKKKSLFLDEQRHFCEPYRRRFH